MQTKTGKRILTAIVSGCMLVANVSLEVRAVEQVPLDGGLEALFSEAVAGYESRLTLTTDSNFNGIKEGEKVL